MYVLQIASLDYLVTDLTNSTILTDEFLVRNLGDDGPWRELTRNNNYYTHIRYSRQMLPEQYDYLRSCAKHSQTTSYPRKTHPCKVLKSISDGFAGHQCIDI
jgi:hypothetical protein